jgi:hypothetical protein
MTVSASKIINPSNAYLVRQEWRKYDPATNTFPLWSGATGTVTLALDSAGTSVISGFNALSLSAATTGVYYRILTAAETATLATYDGDTIYQIVVGGSANELRVVTPLVVTVPRLA